jgi:hypothetical protein
VDEVVDPEVGGARSGRNPAVHAHPDGIEGTLDSSWHLQVRRTTRSEIARLLDDPDLAVLEAEVVRADPLEHVVDEVELPVAEEQH